MLLSDRCSTYKSYNLYNRINTNNNQVTMLFYTINQSLTSLFNLSNLAPHSSFAAKYTAFASSISFSNAAISDCNTSTLRFRKAGEFSISDSSSEGSNGSGGSSLAVSGPSSSDVASECRGDTNGCDFCQDEVDATTGEVAWRDGGVINASKVDAIEDRRNSCRIMLYEYI